MRGLFGAASVHHKNMPGRKSPLIGGKRYREIADVARLSQPACRMHDQEFASDSRPTGYAFQIDLAGPRIDPARWDCIATDTVPQRSGLGAKPEPGMFGPAVAAYGE